MKIFLNARLALDEAFTTATAPAVPGEDSGLPAEVAGFLAHLRLLETVPFQYLLPDDDLLPPESIRFFYLDRNWTDAAVDGALAAGTFTTAERAMLAGRYAEARDAVDQAERNIWATRAGGPGHDGPAEVATGLLLRSRAVSGWPGLHVRAYRGDSQEPMRMLRIERLAPAVLLALIDGIPDKVVLEEPRQGIQFGVDDDDGTFLVNVRDPDDGSATGDTAAVPFRAGAPGVIDMTKLSANLLREIGPPDEELDSAEYALQMLQLPYQQWFGDTPATMPDLLRPVIDVAKMRTWLRLET
jgi:hypothetical protein